MNFDESRRQHDLTHKQKKRLRQRENAALQTLDPAKVARREEKAAQRAQDPERIARLEAHNQKTAENKARVQAKRARNIKESRQHGAGRLLMRKIKIETSDALEHASAVQSHASAVQSHGADNDYVPIGPAIRTRGQRAAQEVNTKLQALATVHSMPDETGTDAFLDRADSLIHQTLASNSALSPTDRKNLEEALSLVRTVQFLPNIIALGKTVLAMTDSPTVCSVDLTQSTIPSGPKLQAKTCMSSKSIHQRATTSHRSMG
jgi:hypothetical protein